MTQTKAIDKDVINKYLSENLNEQKVTEKLLNLGLDKDLIFAYLIEFKRLKFAKRQNKSFLFLTIGSVLGFISCLLTIIDPIPELHNIFMYGLTLIAVLVVFVGLYLLFE